MPPATTASWPVSAYIPCYNNAQTVALTIQGIQNQTHPIDELFVVDDGSADNSAEIVENLGVRVIRMGKNMGRGAVRARAMEAARNDLVLCCDATNRLAPNFLEIALKWFSREAVLGVYGRFYDRHPHTVIDRWRARHLFHQEIPHQPNLRNNLGTFGAVLRKSAVLRLGNFNANLRHGEDFELGERLLAVGDVVSDPALEVEPVMPNTLFQVMERFTRWNRAMITHYTLRNFIESHVVAWRILIPQDIKKRDWPAVLISAMVPYFAVVYADRRSLHPPENSTMEETPPLQTKP